MRRRGSHTLWCFVAACWLAGCQSDLDEGGAEGTGANTSSGGQLGSGTGGANSGTGAGDGSGGDGSGSGGADGGAGTGGSDPMPEAPAPSEGCELEQDQAAQQWVEQTELTVDGDQRRWWTWLPANYDPSRAYPVIFLFHGCGDQNNNVAMHNVVGEDAILVRSVTIQENDCWAIGPSSPDIALFDTLVEAVSESLCVDTGRFFAVGYSSGSYLLNTLACFRGDVLRAGGSVAGGAPQFQGCSGKLARVFVHDLDDEENPIDGNGTNGSTAERDRLLEVNGCNAALEPIPEDPAPCVRYQGCDPGYPVLWCATSGAEHGRQDGFAAPLFWSFFSEF